jgi:nitrogen fixation-related uncharacterized protein
METITLFMPWALLAGCLAILIYIIGYNDKDLPDHGIF